MTVSTVRSYPADDPVVAHRRSRRLFAGRQPAAASLVAGGVGPTSFVAPVAAPEANWPGFSPTPVFPLPILEREFQRVQRQQHHHRRKRRRHRRLAAVCAVPLLVALVTAIVIGPTLYQGARAYRQVFVAPVPHDAESPYTVPGAPSPVPAIAEVAAAPWSEPGAELGSGGDTPPLTDLGSLSDGAGPPVWPPLIGLSTGGVGTPTAPSGSTMSDPLIILLLGIDRREDEAARSDTMILISVDPATKQAAMLSLPRDLKVLVPGYGVQKLNAAHAFGEADQLPGGGPGLAVRTIEANFGLPIDYFAQIDFAGFVGIVNGAGGVTIDVPTEIDDPFYPTPDYGTTRVTFAAGRQHFDGERALQYARTRYVDGDFGRAHRQRQVLLALRQSAIDLDLVAQAPALLATFGDTVRTDMPPAVALSLARLGAELSEEAILEYRLDAALTEEIAPDTYYLVPNWAAMTPILSAFAGERIVPPAAALTNPALDIPIRVENATSNPGLSLRVAEVLRKNGFTNVIAAPSTRQLASTEIVDAAGDPATATLIAGLIGFGNDHIVEASPGTSDLAATPTPGLIVIVLGDDAPDPAVLDEAAGR